MRNTPISVLNSMLVMRIKMKFDSFDQTIHVRDHLSFSLFTENIN